MSRDVNEISEYLIGLLIDKWNTDIQVISVRHDEYRRNCCFWIVSRIHAREVMFEYDRSTLDIYIKVEEHFQPLGKITHELRAKGFASFTSEGLSQNFDVLDRTLRKMKKC